MSQDVPKNGEGSFVKCHECKTEFYVTPSRLLKNKVHTCSRKCMGQLNSKRYSQKIKCSCVVCGKELFYKKSRFKQIAKPTCSSACKRIVQSERNKGEGNPQSLGLSEVEKIFWDRVKNCRLRAESKKIDFDIDYKFLMDLFEKQNGLCSYTNSPMKLTGSRENMHDVFSVDRIDSNRGYTRDNVTLCLNIVNRFKGDVDLEYFSKILNAIFKKEKTKSFVTNCKLLTETAKVPKKGRVGDSGFDVYVDRVEDCGNYIKVFTGVAIQPDPNFWFMLVPRSSIYKSGLTMYNSCGIVDKTYTGELIGIFSKTKDYVEGASLPKKGDRVMQLIPQEYFEVELIEVDNLEDTNRKDGGFGSSGV